MSFHQYTLDNGHVLGDLVSPVRDLLDLSTPPVYLGDKVLISKNGSTAFVSSKKNKLNQYIGDVFIYSFNTTTFSWDFVTNIYSVSNSDLTDHQNSSAYVSNFGSDMCCSSDGTILAVGASEFRETNTSKGAVFIYEKTTSGWVYRQRIILVDNNNYKLGYSLCCDDTMSKLFIGTDATSTLTDVYLYEKGTSGTLSYSWVSSFNIKSIANFNSGTIATFGTSLDCTSDGNTLVVGSDNYQQTKNGSTIYPGEVQVFVYESNAWSLKQSFYSDIESNKPSSLTIANGTKLGNKVSISADGSKLMMGTTVGYIFYYEYNSGSAVYTFVKTYNSQFNSTDYGKYFVISKNGNYLLIGHKDENVNVYRYDSSDASNPWTLDQNTNIMNLASNGNSNYTGQYNDFFGTSIAINEDATKLLIGIPGYKSDGTKISGQAMFFYGKKQTTLSMSNVSSFVQSTVTLSLTTNSDATPVYSAYTTEQNVFTVSGNILTITGVGVAQLRVSLTGSMEYTDITQGISVQGTKGSQTINYQAAIETTGTMTLGSKSGITFSSTSGLPVNMSYDNVFLSFDSTTNEFTSLQEGLTTVTLSQSGSTQYYAAPDVTIQYVIGNLQIYTIVSSDSVKFYKDGVPYAQMLPVVVDGESTMGFIDNDGNDIDIANLEEDNPQIELTESDSRIQSNGVYSLYLSTSNNFEIVSKHGNTLQYINFMEYNKGFTGYINISLEEAKTLNFMGNNNLQNIHWVSSNSDTYEAGDYTFRYFVFDNSTILIWNLESLSVEGTGYSPLEGTVKTFSYNGTLQELTLPAGVNTCTVFMWGAGGTTGIGGYTESTITLPSTGMTLYISVGKAGDTERGGGASYVYTMTDGVYTEILVAGGGGVESGGGLISEGDSPATQLTGLKETGIYNGVGPENGSGGGYYSGSNGSGGSGFVGSNVVVESFGVSKNTHGSSRDSREDTTPRLDHHSGVLYKDTCCFNPNKAFTDYYHNEHGGDAGKESQDGFVYIAYGEPPNPVGISDLQYTQGTGTISASLEPSVTSWRYFAFDENVLLKSEIVSAPTATFNPGYESNFKIYAHALDENQSVVGDLQTYVSPTVPKPPGTSVRNMYRRIQISDAGGFKNIRSVENGDHFLTSITRDSVTFGIRSNKFPLSVYLTYNGDINIDSAAFDVNGNALSEVFASSLVYSGGSELL